VSEPLEEAGRSSIFTSFVPSFTFAPRWRMSWTLSLERRRKVANHSVVRKLGAFHLTPSLISGLTPRMMRRTASISGFSG
jgi:hypothetical protein